MNAMHKVYSLRLIALNTPTHASVDDALQAGCGSTLMVCLMQKMCILDP